MTWKLKIPVQQERRKSHKGNGVLLWGPHLEMTTPRSDHQKMLLKENTRKQGNKVY